jgi:hypothetical protein
MASNYSKIPQTSAINDATFSFVCSGMPKIFIGCALLFKPLYKSLFIFSTQIEILQCFYVYGRQRGPKSKNGADRIFRF